MVQNIVELKLYHYGAAEFEQNTIFRDGRLTTIILNYHQLTSVLIISMLWKGQHAQTNPYPYLWIYLPTRWTIIETQINPIYNLQNKVIPIQQKKNHVNPNMIQKKNWIKQTWNTINKIKWSNTINIKKRRRRRRRTLKKMKSGLKHGKREMKHWIFVMRKKIRRKKKQSDAFIYSFCDCFEVIVLGGSFLLDFFNPKIPHITSTLIN